MTASITSIISNPDTSRLLTGFLSVADKSQLRGTCSTFCRDIKDIPQEAKTFLAFESKLPLIREIVRMTPIYRSDVLDIAPHRANQSPQTYAQHRRRTNSAWKYVAAVIIPWLTAISLNNPIVSEVENGMPGSQVIIMFTSAIVAAYALPRFVAFMDGDREPSVPLMQLWHEFKNGDIPSDLLESGAQLEAQLEAHDQQTSAYQEAGGMDRYYAQADYTAGGLDQAFYEARSAPPSRYTAGGLPQAFLGASSARPRGAIIPL